MDGGEDQSPEADLFIAVTSNTLVGVCLARN